METLITKKIKGSVMENIFDNDENCNIRYYNAKNVKDNDYEPEKVYTFEIKIRHNEDQDAEKLLKTATKNQTK